MRSRPTLAGEKSALPGADTIPQSPRGQPPKARLSFSRANRAAAMSTWPPACPSPAPRGARRAHVALRGQWGASGRAARLVPEGAPGAGLRRRLRLPRRLARQRGRGAGAAVHGGPCGVAERGAPTPGSRAGRPGLRCKESSVAPGASPAPCTAQPSRERAPRGGPRPGGNLGQCRREPRPVPAGSAGMR